MTTLTKAHTQWMNRADDEKFSSLDALLAAARRDKAAAAGAKIAARDLHVRAVEGSGLILNGSSGREAALTNWSFGQLCGEADAPASYIRNLPAPLAAECLNNGLQKAGDACKRLLFRKDEGDALTLRAVTSQRYSRIWNADIVERLCDMEARGPWQPAPAAFDGSRGLYMGDRDLFAFMVDNERRIFERQEGGLSRGFFVWNSETGSTSFGVQTFLYEYVCGNHRVWGASDVKELRLRHVGANDTRAFSELRAQLIEYANESADRDASRIVACREYSLGDSREDVISRVLGMRAPGMTQKLAAQAYELAERREDWYGSPRSAWGYAGALTEIARDMPNASDRAATERLGTKVMELAW